MAKQPYLAAAMKMTMHIDEDVLAQVMEITGAKTKTRAVEIALAEMARRHKQRKLFRAGLQLTPAQWDAEAAPKPSDRFDAPDIDHDAVRRFIDANAQRRQQKPSPMVAEDPPSPPPQPGSDD